MFFTIYGHGGHFDHVTRKIWTNFPSHILRSLHMKFEFNWPSGFREDVWKCLRTDDGWTTDKGHQSHWYTNSSPPSLRLRWANDRRMEWRITQIQYSPTFSKPGYKKAWKLPSRQRIKQMLYPHFFQLLCFVYSTIYWQDCIVERTFGTTTQQSITLPRLSRLLH